MSFVGLETGPNLFFTTLLCRKWGLSRQAGRSELLLKAFQARSEADFRWIASGAVQLYLPGFADPTFCI